MAESSSNKKDYGAVVENALLQLEQEGKNQTIQNVIAITGGSRRDIAPAVRETKDRLADRLKREMVAPEMPEEVEQTMRDVWTLAHELASSDFRKLQAANQAEFEAQNSRVVELEELLVKTKIEMKDWRSKAIMANSHADVFEKQLRECRKLLKSAEARLA